MQLKNQEVLLQMNFNLLTRKIMNLILLNRKIIKIQKFFSLKKADIIHLTSLMKKETQLWISTHFPKILKSVKKIAPTKFKIRSMIKSKI